MKRFFILLVLPFILSSCDILTEVAQQIEIPDTPSGPAPLTETEVILGLKEALTIGTDSSIAKVSATNGFFKDQMIKILLPPEAKIITDNLDNPVLKSLGVSSMIDDVILRMNRSAEEASLKAKPIFVNAIKSMSISDAFGILRGSDTSATHYFRMNTHSQLYSEFNPIIKKYLDMDLVSGISTNKAWNTLTGAYNKVAQFSSSLTPINTNLDDYVTKKTINGVFVKLADQEKQIRIDPIARVTDILKRVFG